MPESQDPVHHALATDDPLRLAEVASSDQLARLKEAEQVLELRHNRKKRSSRIAIASQTMVGLVAVGGFFANAYQTYANKQQQQQQAKVDQERWQREFQRAQQADKYRAFFETSVLATDPGNPDKRLVGYALLQEFVEDKDYNGKATLMLEESLAQELRRNANKEGLDDEHQNAVIAILTALAQTSDCHALVYAARSIDKVTLHHSSPSDAPALKEVFRSYVRRLVGRATVVCPSMKDFMTVVRPLRSALMKRPEMTKLKVGTPLEANAAVAQILKYRCEPELTGSGGSECTEIVQGYTRLCAEPVTPHRGAQALSPSAQQALKDVQEQAAACALVREPWVSSTVTTSGAPPAGSGEATSPGVGHP